MPGARALLIKRLKRLSKQHSRKQKGSNNRKKSVFCLARLHRRIRNKRRDFLHKLSTELTKTKSVTVIEDLNVKGMVRNCRLSQSVTDVGWGEFRRMLDYKSQWYGSTLVIVPRFYPSTKMCCSVGSHVVDALTLSVRRWECPNCQTAHDRDVNAAKSLLKIYTGSSPEIYTCGDLSGGESGQALSSHGSLRQESVTRHLSIN